ncbi:MAG TPA: hypothetical protein ENN39_07165 [Desulfonatronum sp.]|nr:hypothetical protein [Desulfonatronum sp.]
MIYLTQDLLFRKGAQRACYRHPSDASLCIKILHDPREDSPGQRETREEIAYYAHLQKRGISWEMLPFYHGQVETNFGTGTVFDLVRDRDGNISRPFFEFLRNPELTRLHLHAWRSPWAVWRIICCASGSSPRT